MAAALWGCQRSSPSASSALSPSSRLLLSAGMSPLAIGSHLFAAPRRASFSAAWGRVAGRTDRVPRECPPATRPAWRRRESARYTLVHPLTESSRKSRTRRAPSRRPGAQQSMTPSTAQPRRPARRAQAPRSDGCDAESWQLVDAYSGVVGATRLAARLAASAPPTHRPRTARARPRSAAAPAQADQTHGTVAETRHCRASASWSCATRRPVPRARAAEPPSGVSPPAPACVGLRRGAPIMVCLRHRLSLHPVGAVRPRQRPRPRQKAAAPVRRGCARLRSFTAHTL